MNLFVLKLFTFTLSLRLSAVSEPRAISEATNILKQLSPVFTTQTVFGTSLTSVLYWGTHWKPHIVSTFGVELK
jgi:hypothetical protein